MTGIDGMTIEGGHMAARLAEIRELNEREAALLAELKVLRQQRGHVDCQVLRIIRGAEAAQLKPSEYRALFGDLRPEIAAALGRASLR